MREVFLAEGLECASEDAFDILDLEIVVSDFHHLYEGADDGSARFCTDRRVTLLLCDALGDLLLNF